VVGMLLRPFRAKTTGMVPEPRALPWAILFGPFGASERATGYAQLFCYRGDKTAQEPKETAAVRCNG